MKQFFHHCHSKSSNASVCGFKILYSNWNSRVSSEIKNFVVNASQYTGSATNIFPIAFFQYNVLFFIPLTVAHLCRREQHPSKFNIICLHRDNVLEQAASQAYKDAANAALRPGLPTTAKVPEAARFQHINFSLPEGAVETYFIDQRTFVDYCW